MNTANSDSAPELVLAPPDSAPVVEVTRDFTVISSGKPSRKRVRRSSEAESESSIDPATLVPALEAMLLAKSEPLSLGEMVGLMEVPKRVAAEAVEKLREKMARPESGLQLLELAGGFSIGTKPEHSELIERMLKEVRRVRLSPAAMECLAIITYRQPITKSEIEAIRGVNVDGVIKTLLDRELVKILGKKDEPGRPLIFGTTENFLMHFGLRSLSDLPPLSEFEQIARARSTGEVEEHAPVDWQALSENQRSQLEELSSAAERELSALDERLKTLKPPKVVLMEERNSGEAEPSPTEDRVVEKTGEEN